MSQFVRRWADWEKPETPSQSTDRTDKTPRIGANTPNQRTDRTDKTPSVSFVSRSSGRPESFSGERCARCLELEAQGIETLYCSRCGYAAELPLLVPTPTDLVYPLEVVRKDLPSLPPVYREEFDWWLDVYLHQGWSREDAERAAFRRTLRHPPARRPARGEHQLQLVEAGEGTDDR